MYYKYVKEVKRMEQQQLTSKEYINVILSDALVSFMRGELGIPETSTDMINIITVYLARRLMDDCNEGNITLENVFIIANKIREMIAKISINITL